MNKLLKIILAILAGIEVAYSIFMPIAMSLLLVALTESSRVSETLLLLIGVLSSIYRGIRILL